jgi:hypothetical protein
MRYADAWPEDFGAVVEPKTATVGPTETEMSVQTVQNLLKSAFPENEVEDPTEVLQNDSVPVEKSVETNTMTTLWIAFGILALFSFYTITSLMNRIETLEAWLHGRMMSRP